MTKQLRAEVVLERWSGHGEGGAIARVVIRGGDYGLYESTPEQIAQAHADAARVNEAFQSAAEPTREPTVEQLQKAVTGAMDALSNGRTEEGFIPQSLANSSCLSPDCRRHAVMTDCQARLALV